MVEKDCGTLQRKTAQWPVLKRFKLTKAAYDIGVIGYANGWETEVIGIGAAILPQSKITSLSQSARLLWLDDNQPAQLVYEMRWRKAALHALHIKAFLTHFRQVVPIMLKGLA